MAFNINAEVLLSGPKNLEKVRGAIERGLTGVTAPVNISLDTNAAKNLATFNAGLATTNTNLKRLSANSVSASKTVASISSSAKKASTANTQLGKSAVNASKGVAKVATNLNEARSEIEAFGKDSALAIRRFAAFTIATGAIFGFVRAVQSGISEAIEFERELVKVSQVTGAADDDLTSLKGTIDELSTTLGINAIELVTIARTFAQTGQSLTQVEDSLRAVSRASLAPTFGSLEQTTEGVIAALNQFGISADKTEEVLGSLNAVSKNFAVESEDLISVIRRAGGVFAASSGDIEKPQEALNDLIAIFTAVRSTTRESADSISTGLRTIFSRVQRPQTIEFLKQFEVNLLDAEDKFVGFFNTFQQLSNKLGQLQKEGDIITFGSIVEELGGIRQLKNLIPAIVQFQKAEEARKVALEGTQSISKDVALATQTLSVQIENLRQRFSKLIRDISQSSTFQSLAKFALTAANSFIGLAEALKPAVPLLTTIASIKLTSTAFEFARGFAGGVRKGGGAGGAGGGLGSLVTGGGGGGAAAASTAQQKQTQSTVVANTSALSNNTTQLKSLNTKIGALQATIARQGQVVGILTNKMAALTLEMSKVPAAIASIPRSVAPTGRPAGRRRGGGGGVGRARFGSGGSSSRKRFQGGGLVDQRRVGFAVNDIVPRPFDVKGGVAVKYSDVLTSKPGGGQSINQQLSVVPQFDQFANTKTERTKAGRDLIGKVLSKKGFSSSGPAKLKGQVEGLANKQTFDEFNDKLNDLFIDTIERSQSVFGEVVGVAPKKIDRDTISKGDKFFRSAAANSFKGVMFENSIKALNGSPLASVDKGGGNAPFDFTQGLGSFNNLFPTLTNTSFVDAKVSRNAAGIIKNPQKGLTNDVLTTAKGNEGLPDLVNKSTQQFAIEIADEVLLAARALPTKKAEGGPTQDTISSLLTPQELVFGPSAVSQVGTDALQRFNKTGDTSALGRFDMSDVSVVPGRGSGDTVPAEVAPGSFVIRKKSALKSGLLDDGDDLPTLARGGGRVGKTVKRAGSGGSFSRKRFQTGGGTGSFAGLGGFSKLSELAVGLSLGLGVLTSLDFSSFEGFVNGISSVGVSLALLYQQFNSGKSQTEELGNAANNAAVKLNELALATESQLKETVARTETNVPRAAQTEPDSSTLKERLAARKAESSDGIVRKRESAPRSDGAQDSTSAIRDRENEKLRRARGAQANLGDAALRRDILTAQADTFEDRAGALSGRGERLRSRQGAISGRLDDINRQRDAASTAAGAAASRAAQARGRLENAQSGKGRADASTIGFLQKEFDKASNEANQLNGSVARLGAAQNQLNSQYFEAQAEIEKTEREIGNLTREISALRKEAERVDVEEVPRQKGIDSEVERREGTAKEAFERETQARREASGPERAELRRRDELRERRRSRGRNLPDAQRRASTRDRLRQRGRRISAGLAPSQVGPKTRIKFVDAPSTAGLTIPPQGLKALGTTLSKSLKPSIAAVALGLAVGPLSDAIGNAIGTQEFKGVRGGFSSETAAGTFGATTGAAQGAALGAGIGIFAGPIGALIAGIGGAIIGGITGFFSGQANQIKFDAFIKLDAASKALGKAFEELGTNFDNEDNVRATTQASNVLLAQTVATASAFEKAENNVEAFGRSLLSTADATKSLGSNLLGNALVGVSGFGKILEAQTSVIGKVGAGLDAASAGFGNLPGLAQAALSPFTVAADFVAKRTTGESFSEAGQRRTEARVEQVNLRQSGEGRRLALELVNEDDLKKADEAFTNLTQKILNNFSAAELADLPDLGELNLEEISAAFTQVDNTVNPAIKAFSDSNKELFNSLAKLSTLSAGKRLQAELKTIAGGNEDVANLLKETVTEGEKRFVEALQQGEGTGDALEGFAGGLVAGINARLKKAGLGLDLSDFTVDDRAIRTDSISNTVADLKKVLADDTQSKKLTDALGANATQVNAALVATETYTRAVTKEQAERIEAAKIATQTELVLRQLTSSIDAFGQAADQLSRRVNNAVSDFTVFSDNISKEVDRILSGDQTIAPDARVNPFQDLAGRTTTELEAGLKRITANVGQEDTFQDVVPILEFGRDLPNALKRTVDTLRNAAPNDAGVQQFDAKTLLSTFEQSAGESFKQLPPFLQDSIRKNLRSTFGGREKGGAGGALGIDAIAQALQEGRGQELQTLVTDFQEQLRAAAESLTNSINTLDDAVIKSANLQLQISRTRASAEQEILSRRQSFEDRFAKFSNTNVDDRDQARQRLRSRVETQVAAGGAGEVPAGFDALNPDQLLANQQRLEDERRSIRSSITSAESPEAGVVDSSQLANLAKQLGQNSAALEGNRKALETLRDDVSRLEAVESELTRIQETRLNQRQRAQLFASRVAGAEGDPRKQREVISEFLRPITAAQRIQSGERISDAGAAAILSSPDAVRDVFGLDENALNQVLANVVKGIEVRFGELVPRLDLGGAAAAQKVGAGLFGRGGTVRGEGEDEKGLISEAKKIRDIQAKLIKDLATQQIDGIQDAQVAFRDQLDLTANSVLLAGEAFKALRKEFDESVKTFGQQAAPGQPEEAAAPPKEAAPKEAAAPPKEEAPPKEAPAPAPPKTPAVNKLEEQRKEIEKRIQNRPQERQARDQQRQREREQTPPPVGVVPGVGIAQSASAAAVRQQPDPNAIRQLPNLLTPREQEQARRRAEFTQDREKRRGDFNQGREQRAREFQKLPNERNDARGIQRIRSLDQAILRQREKTDPEALQRFDTGRNQRLNSPELFSLERQREAAQRNLAVSTVDRPESAAGQAIFNDVRRQTGQEQIGFLEGIQNPRQRQAVSDRLVNNGENKELVDAAKSQLGQVVNNFSQGFQSLAGNFDSTLQGLGPVIQQFSQAAETFKNLPGLSVTLDTKVQPIEVILNGASLLNEIGPKVLQEVLVQVEQKLGEFTKKGDASL